MDTGLSSLQTQLARDIYWTLFSPLIMKHGNSQDFVVLKTKERLAWLQTLDSYPPASSPSPHNQGLGKYFEALWAMFFEHDHQYELLFHNLQVFEDKKTLGEFDFILYDKLAKKHIHLEVCVKFYIYTPMHRSHTSNDLNLWLGPNCHDSLNKKWQHINQQQLQLTNNPNAISLLEQSGISTIESKSAFKGYFFSANPIKNFHKDMDQAQSFFQHKKLHEISETNHKEKLVHIPKSCWLTRYHHKEQASRFNTLERFERESGFDRPEIFASLKEDQHGLLFEDQRMMITPDSWPHSRIS